MADEVKPNAQLKQEDKVTASDVFHKHFDILEVLFAIKISGETVGNRIESLMAIASKDSSLSQMITLHAKSMIEQTAHSAPNFKRESNAFESVVKLIASCAFKASVHSYARKGISCPKKQHWLPVVYLKNFGEKVAKENPKKRDIELPGISFQGHLTVTFVTRDSSFIHKLDADGEGFYEPNAEWFFSNIEEMYGNYSNVSAPQLKNTNIIIPAAFFAIQSARNPHPQANTFIHSRLKDVVMQIIANLDTMEGKLFLSKAGTEIKLPFTPYVPQSVMRTATNDKVFVFPIHAQSALVMSTSCLPPARVRHYVKSYRHGVIVKARRDNATIFGVEKSDINFYLK